MTKRVGRPPNEHRNVSRNIRLTDPEWEIFKRYLGARWLRCQIRKTAVVNNEQLPDQTNKE